MFLRAVPGFSVGIHRFHGADALLGPYDAPRSHPLQVKEREPCGAAPAFYAWPSGSGVEIFQAPVGSQARPHAVIPQSTPMENARSQKDLGGWGEVPFAPNAASPVSLELQTEVRHPAAGPGEDQLDPAAMMGLSRAASDLAERPNLSSPSQARCACLSWGEGRQCPPVFFRARLLRAVVPPPRSAEPARTEDVPF